MEGWDKTCIIAPKTPSARAQLMHSDLNNANAQSYVKIIRKFQLTVILSVIVIVTFYSVRLVSSLHSLNKRLVKWLGKLWGHGNMKIWFVAFQHSVQSELADCISYHLWIKHMYWHGIGFGTSNTPTTGNSIRTQVKLYKTATERGLIPSKTS